MPSADVSRLPSSDQWQTIKTEEIQLDIPPAYVGGDPELQLPEIQLTLTELGFGDRTEWLAQNVTKIDLLAFKEIGRNLNTINVVQETASETARNVDSYVLQQISKLEAAGLTVEQQVFDPAFPDRRVFTVKNPNVYQIVYVYFKTDVFWVITYSGDVEVTQPDIQRSSQSFQILSEMS